MTFKTVGIIIKRSNLGEADRILTILTSERGKIKVIAKGIRKIKSKLAGSLELFCLSSLMIAEGRNLDIVCGAEIKKCFLSLRKDLSATQHAFYFAELIEKMSEEQEPHPEVFNLLDDVLENLNNLPCDLLIPYFEWNFLTELGYHPEMYRCSKCQKKVGEAEKIYFNVESGIVCEGCKKSDREISVSTIKLLRLFLKHQINALSKIQLDGSTLKETRNITRSYLNQISDKEFRSQRFVK